MPPSLTTAQLNRVHEVLDNESSEEGGLAFVIVKIEERREQNILDDSIYRDFINFYRQEVLDGLAIQEAFLDASDPIRSPHSSKFGNDFPPTGGDDAANDLNNWAIWRPPYGDIDSFSYDGVGPPPGTRIVDASQNYGFINTGSDKILFTSGNESGNSYTVIAIETTGSTNDTIVVTANISATLTNGDDFVIINSIGLAVSGDTKGNATRVYRRDPPINFNPTAEPDATIDNAVALGNPFFFMRWDDRVGTKPQLATKADQQGFLEDFLDNTEGKNDAYRIEVGTP